MSAPIEGTLRGRPVRLVDGAPPWWVPVVPPNPDAALDRASFRTKSGLAAPTAIDAADSKTIWKALKR